METCIYLFIRSPGFILRLCFTVKRQKCFPGEERLAELLPKHHHDGPY